MVIAPEPMERLSVPSALESYGGALFIGKAENRCFGRTNLSPEVHNLWIDDGRSQATPWDRDANELFQTRSMT
jgi:hypothetical protein